MVEDTARCVQLPEAEGLQEKGTALRTFLITMMITVRALGQAVHLSGGESTLLNAAGGGATIYLNNQQLYLGGGRGVGASDQFKFDGLDWNLGDSNFSFAVDGAGTTVFNRGIQITKKTNGETFGAFAGLAGISYQVPFFSSLYEARYPGVGFFFQKRRKDWKWSSLDLVSRQKTLVQSVSYNGHVLKVFGFGGIVQNSWQFGATILFRPTKDLSLVAADVSQLNLKNENVTATLTKGKIDLRAGFIEDTYEGRKNAGENAGIGLRHGWLTVRSDWYDSNHQQQIAESLIENTRNWSLTETISNTNQFGGSIVYHNNSVQLSLSHSIVFLPTQGYQQVISAGIALHVHDSGMNTSAYLLPGNKLKYTTSADQWLQGPYEGRDSQSHQSIGNNVIQGMVVKEDGSPIEGIAIQIGKSLVYSNSAGVFELRTRKKQKQELPVVDLEESLAPGNWQVVSCTLEKIILRQIQ